MSTQIDEVENTGAKGVKLTFTAYWGGDEKGQMIQLTQGTGLSPDEPGFIQLTPYDAYRVLEPLVEWLKNIAAEKAAVLRKAIEEDTRLEKTILKDAVDCEHYIAEMKILDIPIFLLTAVTK